MANAVLGKNPPEKSPPDSKLNPIPNLTLALPLTPHGGFFPEGFFADTGKANTCLNSYKLQKRVLYSMFYAGTR